MHWGSIGEGVLLDLCFLYPVMFLLQGRPLVATDAIKSDYCIGIGHFQRHVVVVTSTLPSEWEMTFTTPRPGPCQIDWSS